MELPELGLQAFCWRHAGPFYTQDYGEDRQWPQILEFYELRYSGWGQVVEGLSAFYGCSLQRIDNGHRYVGGHQDSGYLYWAWGAVETVLMFLLLRLFTHHLAVWGGIVHRFFQFIVDGRHGMGVHLHREYAWNWWSEPALAHESQKQRWTCFFDNREMMISFLSFPLRCNGGVPGTREQNQEEEDMLPNACYQLKMRPMRVTATLLFNIAHMRFAPMALDTG